MFLKVTIYIKYYFRHSITTERLLDSKNPANTIIGTYWNLKLCNEEQSGFNSLQNRCVLTQSEYSC